MALPAVTLLHCGIQQTVHHQRSADSKSIHEKKYRHDLFFHLGVSLRVKIVWMAPLSVSTAVLEAASTEAGGGCVFGIIVRSWEQRCS